MQVKKDSKVYIYGKHALIEALSARPDVVRKVYLAPRIDDAQLLSQLERLSVPTALLGGREKESANIDFDDVSHQGVVAIIDTDALMQPFDAFIDALPTDTAPGLVLLDEVHDPQNVGAVIRSAAAFGLSGILMPEHNQAQVTGAVVKVSAGMAFRIPLVRIGNVNQTIRVLKDRGFWVYGLDMQGTPVHQEQFSKPSVFVLGNEAKGIRPKTLELCDAALSIAMNPRTESLNAATAAAVVMHAWSVQHPEAL